MEIAICCIAKNENKYLLEWVNYHLNLGVTHIFIYDNNELDGDHIEDVLSDYITNNQVTIIDCRGKKAYQAIAYTEFYHEYGNSYNWIAYIDVDEFITFSNTSGYSNLSDYLNTINGFDIIHINWMCFGDNGIVDFTCDVVVNRFLKPLAYDKYIQYDFPENNHVKSIIRGGLNMKGVKIVPHSPKGDFRICDENGVERTENEYFKPYSFNTIYLRHYVTKTIYEWIEKISRGRATDNSLKDLYTIERFFKYNEDTDEKRKVIKQYLFFNKALNSRYKTELYILKIDLEIEQYEHGKLKKYFSTMQNSKAYRLGKILLKPFSLLKNYNASFQKNKKII